MGLNQTEFAALLGWTSKRNIVSLERGDKDVMVQTALAVECLLRRENKFEDLLMLDQIKNDVEKQKTAIKELLDSENLTIAITDNVCALCFKSYATKEDWSGDEFEIAFENSSEVEVSKKDFIAYQLQFSKMAIELEEKYSDFIDELRDAQNDIEYELLET